LPFAGSSPAERHRFASTRCRRRNRSWLCHPNAGVAMGPLGFVCSDFSRDPSASDSAKTGLARHACSVPLQHELDRHRDAGRCLGEHCEFRWQAHRSKHRRADAWLGDDARHARAACSDTGRAPLLGPSSATTATPCAFTYLFARTADPGPACAERHRRPTSRSDGLAPAGKRARLASFEPSGQCARCMATHWSRSASRQLPVKQSFRVSRR
jgi:hypothetical protein